MSYAKNWCFTINNFTLLDFSTISAWDVSYAIYGEEVGDSGTPHLQGYAMFRKKLRLTALKKLHSTAHWELSKGTAEQNRVYCSKQGKVTTLGSFPVTAAGKRCDLDAFKHSVKEGIIDLKTLREEHSDVYAKYPRFCREYVNDYLPEPVLAPHALNDWQSELNQVLILEPDDRSIIFVVDPKGNTGKTWFAKYFCSLHPSNSQILKFCREADMAYALEPHIRYLFMNCSREQIERINYSFLESIKDGMVFSSKYESVVKKLGAVHVVVLMNDEPDFSKLSCDRYKFIRPPQKKV